MKYIAVAFYNEYIVDRSNQDPVYEWWKDLFIWTEPECMTYLQSKPIPIPSIKSSSSSSSVSSSAMSRQVPHVFYPYETIRHTLENRRTISETFSSLKRWVPPVCPYVIIYCETFMSKNKNLKKALITI